MKHLQQLTSAEIAKAWPQLKSGIMSLMPETSDATAGKLLQSAVTGMMDVWLLVETDEEGKIISSHGVLTTRVMEDGLGGLGDKTLLIYTLSAYDGLREEEWEGGFEMLKRHARKRGCSSISAMTKNPRVLGVVKRLGGDTRQRFVTMEV
jgi:hypothetical protein